MSRNLERVSSSSTSSSGGRRGPARPCGRVTTRTVIGPCGRAGATSARAGCFFVFGLDFSRACRCCLLCTCDLIYIRVHRSVCAPRHACCVLLRPATDNSGPFAQCVCAVGACEASANGASTHLGDGFALEIGIPRRASRSELWHLTPVQWTSRALTSRTGSLK